MIITRCEIIITTDSYTDKKLSIRGEVKIGVSSPCSIIDSITTDILCITYIFNQFCILIDYILCEITFVCQLNCEKFWIIVCFYCSIIKFCTIRTDSQTIWSFHCFIIALQTIKLNVLIARIKRIKD